MSVEKEKRKRENEKRKSENGKRKKEKGKSLYYILAVLTSDRQITEVILTQRHLVEYQRPYVSYVRDTVYLDTVPSKK